MKAEIYKDDLGKEIEETEVPADMMEMALEYREKMLEAAAESDEDLMMKYLEGEELTEDEIRAGLRKGTIDVTMTPVLCGSSFKNKGVQMLLDAVVDYLPSPTDVPDITGINPDTGEEDSRPSSDDAPFAALAFKVMTDPFVGKLTYFRVYSGTLQSGSYVYNSTKGKKERVGRLLQMHANSREEVSEVYAGDIVAGIGFKDTTTGDSLCDEKNEIILESMEFPEPVIDVAIEPKTQADQEKMGIALAKLAEEDPTFKVHTDKETGQTIIAGMGELHLEIIVDRLLREFKVEANVGQPQVAYKETIRSKITGVGKHVKQSGGHGQNCHCVEEIEPNEPAASFTLENNIEGPVVQNE